MTPNGKLEGINRQKDDWKVTWESKETECDVYGKCGVFGICNPKNSPICSCLRGYEPKSMEELIRGNWTSGCVRKTPLQCQKQMVALKREQGVSIPCFDLVPLYTIFIYISMTNCSDYMSPEYAMEGIFSEKSDVFIFEVLLLKIISGKKSISFCHDKQSLGLLGYASVLYIITSVV